MIQISEMKRFVDKLRALWVLARAKEFALFTCDDFKTSKGGNCWISYGISEKEYISDVFLDAAQEYIEKLKS